MEADDLEKLIYDLGLGDKLRKVTGDSDTNYMVNCPYHGESHPSMGISAEKEIFNCYACSENGSILKLVMYMKDFSYKRARDYLEERFNVTKRTTGKKAKILRRYDEETGEWEEIGKDKPTIIPTYNLAPYKSGKVCHDYILSRGFTKETCRIFKLGWDSSRCRITIPIFNRNNDLLGFLARSALDEKDPNYKKVYGERDKYLVDNFQRSHALFPINFFPEDEDTAILVEGTLDAMKGHQLGFKNVLAVLSSKLSKRQLKLLNQLHVKKIVLAFDNDKAGQDGIKKAYEMLKNDFIVYKVTYPRGKDMGDMNKEEIQEMLDNKSFYNVMKVRRFE